MTEVWRLVDSGFSHPARTAALDEVITRARGDDIVPDTLHFYVRRPPCVSLGYFQKVKEDVNYKLCERYGIYILRRMTGGSAVYTDDGQLIYAVALKNVLPEDRNESYRMVCGALVDALGYLGIKADFKPINDIQVNGKKVSGSAQLRKWGVVLQHGTLLINTDIDRMFSVLRILPEKIKEKQTDEARERVVNLSTILGRDVTISEVKECMIKGFENEFKVKIEPGEFTEYEENLCRETIMEKYGDPEWNFMR